MKRYVKSSSEDYYLTRERLLSRMQEVMKIIELYTDDDSFNSYLGNLIFGLRDILDGCDEVLKEYKDDYSFKRNYNDIIYMFEENDFYIDSFDTFPLVFTSSDGDEVLTFDTPKEAKEYAESNFAS